MWIGNIPKDFTEVSLKHFLWSLSLALPKKIVLRIGAQDCMTQYGILTFSLDEEAAVLLLTPFHFPSGTHAVIRHELSNAICTGSLSNQSFLVHGSI